MSIRGTTSHCTRQVFVESYGGPNCRSRSVLRHYPVGSRPVCESHGGEFGRLDATEARPSSPLRMTS